MHKAKLSFLSVLGCIVLVGVCGILALIAANPIDQVMTYSTFLGGKFDDTSRDIAVDSDGFVYVVGETRSTNFPITDGSINSKSYDVFVAKFNPGLADGAHLIWSVVIGGSGYEKGVGIALDVAGNVYVVGSTSSSDFPSTDETFLIGNKSIFVVRLDNDGLWQDDPGFATIIGQGGGYGPGYKDNVDIVVDSLGHIYLTGNTGDPGFFTIHGAPLNMFTGGSTDAFVAKFVQTGNSSDPLDLEYGTFIGGSYSEHAYGIAVDGSGNSYIAGGTDSFDFPTSSNGLQRTLMGTYDAFMVKLDAKGIIQYGTYLGGNEGTGGGSEEIGLDIAVDASGKAYVAGRTSASNFPTKNAFDSTHNGGNDAFFVVLNPTLIGENSLLYSTYLGGSLGERGVSLAVDASGNAYVFGRTLSNDFPTTSDAFDTTFNGRHDDFLAILNPALEGEASLVSSTFWGGIREDSPGAIALHTDVGDISAYLSGSTGSRRDFPITSEAYDESYNGGQTDVFLSILTFQEVQPPDAPAAPSDLIATTFSCSEIDLSWHDSSTNEDGFAIERSEDGVDFIEIDTVGANVATYHDTGLAETTQYWYQVRAYNAGGNSDYSNIASDINPSCPVGSPVAPTDLTAKVRGKNKIALKWKDNSNYEDGFAIERRTDDTSFAEIYKVGSNTTSYLNTDLQSKILYYYRVRAYNSYGNSNYSNTASARTK